MSKPEVLNFPCEAVVNPLSKRGTEWLIYCEDLIVARVDAQQFQNENDAEAAAKYIVHLLNSK
jgi:hypothetical protein